MNRKSNPRRLCHRCRRAWRLLVSAELLSLPAFTAGSDEPTTPSHARRGAERPHDVVVLGGLLHRALRRPNKGGAGDGTGPGEPGEWMTMPRREWKSGLAAKSGHTWCGQPLSRHGQLLFRVQAPCSWAPWRCICLATATDHPSVEFETPGKQQHTRNSRWHESLGGGNGRRATVVKRGLGAWSAPETGAAPDGAPSSCAASPCSSACARRPSPSGFAILARTRVNAGHSGRLFRTVARPAWPLALPFA
jgi:hypothetical protein